MKTIIKSIAILLLTSFSFVACAQETKETDHKADNSVAKVQELQMNKDTLNARVLAEIEKEIVKRKIELTAETLATLGKTRELLADVEKGNKETAIEKGKELIGNLEVLLTKSPDLALVPVNVSYQVDELITDIESVKKMAKEAKEALKKGYYREASDLLNNMRSEITINTYLIPTATYPEAIKTAVILLEDDNIEGAKRVLSNVLTTVVVEKTVLPIPVLNAEQMIIEAALIDAKDHENADQVINLLENADYQLKLAEELGYGKRDKEFKALAGSIKELKKSVKNKENSTLKFDNLKAQIKKFEERLFPKTKK